MILSLDTLRRLRSTPTILLDGCFGPLHAGHVAYLQSARRLFPQYRVVVAVAPDDTIREKGRAPLLTAESRAAVVGAIAGVDDVFVHHMSIDQVIALLRPQIYVKGKDWEGKLPEAITAACALFSVPVVYLDTVTDSSSDRLRRWALADAERGLDALEAFCSTQTPASVPWQPVTDYSFEARKAIEGPHADIIAREFAGCSVLDYGCGPGHLLRLLRERGMNAAGYEPHEAVRKTADPVLRRSIKQWLSGPGDDDYRDSDFADLVVCREVLEHVPVVEIARVVASLFEHAKKYVYITTRFTDRGVFDAATDLNTDPTHITCLSQPLIRALCVLNGGRRRRDLEEKLDHLKKGRVLVYEV